MISLKSGHIHIDNKLATNIFGVINHAYVVYVQKRLLITPVSSQWITKIHGKPAQVLLKTKNLKGDKTLSIGGLLIDNELDATDRTLEFEIVQNTRLIKIDL